MNILFSVKRYASYGIYKVLQFPRFFRVTRNCLTRALVPDLVINIFKLSLVDLCNK